MKATAGPGETFLHGPQTFSWGPSGKKIFELPFQNGAFWCVVGNSGGSLDYSCHR